MTRIALAVSIAVFVVLGTLVASRIGIWHEEVSVYPSVGARIVDDDGNGRPRVLARCVGERPPRIVVSHERPVFVACMPDRSLPIMVSAYFAGYLYWPAELLHSWHHDDALKLRLLGIALGILELLSAWALLRRIGGDAVAAAGAIAIAASTPYVYVHALLVHYEFTPWMFLGCALLAWLPPSGAAALSPTRFLLGALLLGLALAGNVKTVFLLFPVALYARSRGLRLPSRLRSWTPAAGALALLPLAPLGYLALVDPWHGFSGQATWRASVAMHKLFSTAWIREPLNLLRFWSDIGSYGDEIEHLHITGRWTWLLPAAALVHCVRHAFLALRRRPHEPISAACGLLLGTYFVVCVLLYDQHPDANYAPLHTVFGAATGAFCAEAGRWMAVRARRPALASTFAVTLASFAAVGFGYNVVRRAGPGQSLGLPFSLVAQRALVRAVENGPPGDVLTTTYNLGGVLDSLSEGAIHAVQVHPYLSRCNDVRGAARQACLEERFRRLLTMADLRRPLSIALPARATMVDERFAADLLPSIERAAADVGLHVEERDDFLTGAGVPGLVRVVVR